ncbi:MAG: MFS transporter [Marinibacterium sp.]
MTTAQASRRQVWGWYFFDWASQPYHTLLVTFIFGPFFAGVATQFYQAGGLDAEAAGARAQSLWAWGMGLAGLIIAFGAPFMGAFADTTGRRIPWIAAFSVLYVAGSGLLWFTDPAGSNLIWMLLAFAIGFVGAEYALIFVNSQLPDLAAPDEVGELSGNGFAFGYAGGLLSLAIMLALFAEQGDGRTLAGLAPAFGLLDAEAREGTRAVGPFTALWFAVFMIPYFLWMRDGRPTGERASFGAALASLGRAIRNAIARKSLLSYLCASMFYRDGLNGLYAFGGTYAVLVLGWSVVQVGVFGIIALIASAAFCWAGGKADRRFGPKPVIVVSIFVLIGICTLIVGMSRDQIFGVPLAEGSALPDRVFLFCGALIGGMGGILQSTSRSLMVRHTEPESATEAFGLYGLSGRATSFIAPLLIGIATTMTESPRLGVSPVIGLFVIGLLLLLWVKPRGILTE